ncbi:glycine-rich domain-containing protein [Kitasatospora sp. NPDC052896]|uniref:glycine-rich domain-containing protein n=1 Tax=Kitasatospora sp. NPDC052896 TaxID=3364061 RepID=UPI0037C4FCD2
MTTALQEARNLIPPDTFAAVAATVRDNNPGVDQHLAERIVREALKFVATCGRFRDHGMAPSRIVDEGWHALVLHTRAYEELCARVGGPVHHFPERPDPSRFDGAVLAFTTSMMRQAGYPADTRWGDPLTGEIVVAANCQHSPPDCQVTCMNKPG